MLVCEGEIRPHYRIEGCLYCRGGLNVRFYVLSFGTLVCRPYNGGVLNSESRNKEVPLYT